MTSLPMQQDAEFERSERAAAKDAQSDEEDIESSTTKNTEFQ